MKPVPENFRRDAERQRLARLLACHPDELHFLDALSASELRLLRLATKEWLGRTQHPLLMRAIQASTLLPSALVASIGRDTFGPLLTARFSDYMNRTQLVSIGRHHSPAFLAEVGLHLDADKLCELAVAMPPTMLRGIVREVLARHEYIMLGELIDRLPPTRLPHVAREMTEGEPYLRTMFFVESPARRQEIVEMLPEGVLYDSMRAVARAPDALLPMALSLTLEVSPAWQRRMAVYALENADSLLGDLIAGVVRLDLWRIALPLVERLSPQEIGRLMHLPIWQDPSVIDTLLKGSTYQFMRPWVDVLLDQLPPEQAALARQRLSERAE